LLCIGTAVSFAQGHHKGRAKGTIEDRVNSRLDKMDGIVKFTGNQRTDLKSLFLDLAKKKKDAFCTNEIGTDGMKNAMQMIHKEQKDGMKKILTNDQWKLLKAYRKAKQDERKKNHGKKGNHDDPEK
jgi:hypothetical protein